MNTRDNRYQIETDDINDMDHAVILGNDGKMSNLSNGISTKLARRNSSKKVDILADPCSDDANHAVLTPTTLSQRKDTHLSSQSYFDKLRHEYANHGVLNPQQNQNGSDYFGSNLQNKYQASNYQMTKSSVYLLGTSQQQLVSDSRNPDNLKEPNAKNSLGLQSRKNNLMS